MTIRPATLEDLPALLVLGEQMHAESPRFSRLTFSRARLEATLRQLLASDAGFLWVAERDGHVIGGMAALVMQHWASDDVVASDLALFVDSAYRGGMAPLRLVQRYRAWARECGAVLRQLGITTGVATEQTARLYERIGFTRCGIILED